MRFGIFLERDGELGLAGLLRIVESFSGAIGFAGFEIKAALHAVRETGEPGFAIDVGADLKIELVETAESVGDMNFDRRGIEGLAGVVGDREVGGAGAQTAIDRGDGVRIGSLGKGRGHEQQKYQSSHLDTL